MQLSVLGEVTPQICQRVSAYSIVVSFSYDLHNLTWLSASFIGQMVAIYRIFIYCSYSSSSFVSLSCLQVNHREAMIHLFTPFMQ